MNDVVADKLVEALLVVSSAFLLGYRQVPKQVFVQVRLDLQALHDAPLEIHVLLEIGAVSPAAGDDSLAHRFQGLELGSIFNCVAC